MIANQFMGSGYKKALNLVLTSENFNKGTASVVYKNMSKIERDIRMTLEKFQKNNGDKNLTFDLKVTATWESYGDHQVIQKLKALSNLKTEKDVKDFYKLLQGKQNPRKCKRVNYIVSKIRLDNKIVPVNLFPQPLVAGPDPDL